MKNSIIFLLLSLLYCFIGIILSIFYPDYLLLGGTCICIGTSVSAFIYEDYKENGN